MGNFNNLASADVSEADKIKAINKELSKFSQKYEDLPPRTQKYLLLAEDFLIDQSSQMNRLFKDFKSVSFSVDVFCTYAGITRQALYKKNSNRQQSYKPVIDFINSAGPKCESKRQEVIRDYIRSGTIDQQLMNSLLSKEAERMKIKRELEEKNAQIRTLEAKVKALERQLNNMHRMS